MFILENQYDLSHFAYDITVGAVDYRETAGLFWHPGYTWPNPPGPWFGIILMHKEDLTTRVIAHEATHAAMEIYHADMLTDEKMKHPTKFIHEAFNGSNETIAYMVGDLSRAIVQECYLRKLFP